MKTIRAMVIGAAVVWFALLGGAARSAETPDEDQFDRLGIALALDAQCKALPAWESWYLHKVWRNSLPGSKVDARIREAQHSALYHILPTLILSPPPSAAYILRQAVAGYRAKASALGCEAGAPYLRAGRVAAVLMLGKTLHLAHATRGKAPTWFELAELTAEQRELIGVFMQHLRSQAADNAVEFEKRMQEMAEADLRQLSGMRMFEAKQILKAEHDEAFAVLRAEVIATQAGHATRLIAYDLERPMDRLVIEWRRQNGATLRLQGLPQQRDIPENCNWKWRSHAVFALKPDNSGMLGLFGEDTPAIADRLRGFIRIHDSAQRKFQLHPLQKSSQDCLFTLCLAIPAALARQGTQLIFNVDEPPANCRIEGWLDIDEPLLKAQLAR
ncbi:MAG: hypothetical protein N2423_05190 [Novosphingobium sp.]|nr:hypothetical protein [Novosphingobium sp.]